MSLGASNQKAKNINGLPNKSVNPTPGGAGYPSVMACSYLSKGINSDDKENSNVETKGNFRFARN